VKTGFSDLEAFSEYDFYVNNCDFEANPTGCRNSLSELVYGDDYPPYFELFWYDSEIVLNDNLLDRTPWNPTNAENTYLVRPKKNTYEFQI
jgi:hypothetical protein